MGTALPHCVATEGVNQNVHRKPRAQRQTVGQAGKRSEKQRNLRPVKRNIQTIGCLWYQFLRQFRLRPHVVKRVSAVSQREISQSIEMQKIRALDQTVAVQ